MAKKEGMEDTIVSLIMNSLHTLEFETGWKEMITTFDCADHDHIKRMWRNREKFVPAYFKGCFCPFTRTTGRSESFNSIFKDYVLRKDTIENFLKQYELFQENVVETENADRFQSTQQQPTYWCNNLLERHAAKVYTRGIYLKFVSELVNSTAFAVHEVVKDRLYELKKSFYYEKPEYICDLFTVCVDRVKQSYECECGKFEKDGILCCHILRLFTQFDVVKIPEDYLVPRWTIKFREDELLKHQKEFVEVHGSKKSESTLRYALLMNSLNDVCSELSKDANKSRVFLEEVRRLHKELMSSDVDSRNNDANAVHLKDPPVIKKGSTKKNKGNGGPVISEVVAEPSEISINIWVNEDGSVSEPVEQNNSNIKSTKGRRQQKEQPSQLKDPPISKSKSVPKGSRMKPQSEKKSRKKPTSKVTSSNAA
jgi:hypothetical protein